VRRAGPVAGAVVCLVLVVLVVLLAADVWRWRDALRSDDVRYRSAPSSSDLWDPASFVPLALARNSLGVDDDLAFRRAVRAMRLGKLEDARAFDTKVLLQRADAQTRLAAIAEDGGDPERRSRAMTLLGVVLLATPVPTVEEQAAALKAAITNLQTAIELDPDNSDAKFNLEFALRQRSAGLSARGGSSPNPLGNPNRSRGAATGAAGSGY
jgi:tetratricopeptide (TPR) repeat protein